MYSLWLAHSSKDMRQKTREALLSICPDAVFELVDDPIELRKIARQEMGELEGVIIGPSDKGVSDENLAAALKHDGISRIILAAQSPSGSLRSRAAQAGVEQVIDLNWLDGKKTGPRAKNATAQNSTAKDQRHDRNDLDLPHMELDEVEEVSSKKTAVLPRTPEVKKPEIQYELEVEHEELSPLLVFSSGRGGVGKTTLAVCAAALCASWGMRTALLDLDLSCGNAFSYLGIGQPTDINRILAEGTPSAESMGRSAAKAACGVSLWGPCERPEQAESIFSYIPELIAYVRSRFDVVIVDTSTTFTDAVAEAAQNCSYLYLVQDALSGGLGPVVRTNSLALRLGVARTRIVRLENGAPETHVPKNEDFTQDVSLDGMTSFGVLDGGSEVSELLSAGKVEDLLLLENPMVSSLAQLIARNLSDLGALPDCEGAKKALVVRKRKLFSLFRKRA